MILIVFATTRAFLKGREVLSDSKIPFEIRTTPRYLTEQCGMCIAFDEKYRDRVEVYLPSDRSDLVYVVEDKENKV